MRWASSSVLWSCSSARRSLSRSEVSVVVMAFPLIGTEQSGGETPGFLPRPRIIPPLRYPWRSMASNLLLVWLINTLIRPLVVLLTLPATVLTLGLFIFVVNGLLFWFVASFVKGFSVAGFWSAVLGAIVYALISWAASALVFGPPRVVVVRRDDHR